EVGWFAKPARYSAPKSQSPERSPVNTRPVRLPPWAAGARPTTAMHASGSPKPGTGRAQYTSSRKAARRVTATSSRQATSRGPARQATISDSRRPRASRPDPTWPFFIPETLGWQGQMATPPKPQAHSSAKPKAAPSTLVLLVRHGTTPSTGQLLPG